MMKNGKYLLNVYNTHSQNSSGSAMIQQNAYMKSLEDVL